MTAGLMGARCTDCAVLTMTASARVIATTAQIATMTPKLIIAPLGLVDVFRIFMVYPFPIELLTTRMRRIVAPLNFAS